MSGADPMANVALRPWPTPAKDALTKEDVNQQLSQLITERGHFRGITEDALQSEIDGGKSVPEDVMEGIEHEKKKEGPSRKEKLEEMQRVRNEMHSKLEWASFAAGNALNLVNLILSRDAAKNLESAYTPMFRQQNVPRASFGLDRVDRVDKIDKQTEEAQRRELVMKGSRMEALDWATDSLLKAATELETGIRKETKYWDEVLSISEKGWSLQRTRRDVRNAPFAVHYGFPEATNQFKARGLAPLRMNKEGGIILDSSLSLKPKTVRVRVSDNGRTVGISHLPVHSGLDELAIEQSIQLARESLFEEELFHEMSIESRTLLAYGVELRNSVIHITAPGLSGRSAHRKLLIDCVSRDDNLTAGQDHSQDWLAKNVAETLRLLLVHEHRMRLHRRSQIPPPMTQYKPQQQQQGSTLLHTLLCVFSHLTAVDSLHAYLNAAAKTLKSAGLDVTLEASRETSWVKLTNTMKEQQKKDLSAIDQLLATFTRHFEGTASLSLPSASGVQPENIVIATRTYIGQPTFGAEHKLTLPPSFVKVLNLTHEQQRQFKFSSTEEAQSYLDWVLSLDIAHNLLYKEYSGRSVIKSQQPRISILSKGSKRGLVKEDNITVELEKGVLKVSAIANVQLSTGTAADSFAWNGNLGQGTLKEKVKTWVG